jgi:hypothetical protein
MGSIDFPLKAVGTKAAIDLIVQVAHAMDHARSQVTEVQGMEGILSS